MTLFKEGESYWKFTLIIFILAFVIGGGSLGYFCFRLKRLETRLAIIESRLIGSRVSDDKATSRKDYINEEYGFEAKYPEEFVIKEVRLSQPSTEQVPEQYQEGYQYEKPVSLLFSLEIYTSTTKKDPEIGIDVYNANDFSVSEWISYINEGVGQGLIYEGRYIDVKELVSVLGIGSVKAFSGCCGYCTMNVFIPKDNKIYNLKQSGYISPAEKCQHRYYNESKCCLEYDDTFNQILSSFRFLE